MLSTINQISNRKKDIPNLVRVYDLRSKVYYVLHLNTLAEISLKKAMDYEKSYRSERHKGRFYERLGDLSIRKKQFKTAIKYYEMALKIDPSITFAKTAYPSSLVP